MSREARIVATQAAVVAVLVAVVYLTLLRPDEGVTPSGIDVPGATPGSTLHAGPPADHGDRRRGSGPPRDGRLPDAAGPGATSLGPSASGFLPAGAVGGGPASVLPPGGFTGFDPGDDQYDEAVGSVLRRLYKTPTD